jgi:hypothetical protein
MDSKTFQARAFQSNSDVRGRDIARLILFLVSFWGRHRTTLAPYIDQSLLTALDALANAAAAVMLINPPGPD